MTHKELIEGTAPNIAVIDGWQQTMSRALAHPNSSVPPRELAAFYRRALFEEERHNPNERDDRLAIELQLRQAFVRTLGSLAIPRLLERATDNLTNPTDAHERDTTNVFVGYGERSHQGLRAAIAHVALNHVIDACDATIGTMDPDHFSALEQEFADITIRANELSGVVLDSNIGSGWQDIPLKEILAKEFRWKDKPLNPATKLVLVGSHRTPDLRASFTNAVSTGVEYGALGVAGMRHALRRVGHVERDWNPLITSRIRMLTTPASLPFWVAHRFAADREGEESITDLYSASAPGTPLDMRFTDEIVQRFYTAEQRTRCQGAATEPCLAPDGEEHVRIAYQSISKQAQIDGLALETDVAPDHIRDGLMSGAMATSWLVLTTALRQ